MTRPWTIQLAAPETRYPGHRVPAYVLACLLRNPERSVTYKVLDTIAMPGVLYSPGTKSRGTALGWLCDWTQKHSDPHILPEPDTATVKVARFWVYRLDEETVCDEMRRARGNLAAIAASFFSNFEGVGGPESRSVPAGGQPLTTAGTGVPKHQQLGSVAHEGVTP
jgi:hypothetical protein